MSAKRLAIAVVALELLAFAGMLYGAHILDARNGISTCQSLANWGMHVCR